MEMHSPACHEQTCSSRLINSCAQLPVLQVVICFVAVNYLSCHTPATLALKAGCPWLLQPAIWHQHAWHTTGARPHSALLAA